MIVIIEARCRKLIGLLWCQHPQSHASFQTHGTHTCDDLDNLGHVALLGIAPCRAHAEPLAARIARLRKSYIALMDGLVMGGGVGVSAHGSVRIVTERTKLAMPEVGIGFVPDVGGTYLLSAAPGEFGTHAALTGETLGAADVILCGLAGADSTEFNDALDSCMSSRRG